MIQECGRLASVVHSLSGYQKQIAPEQPPPPRPAVAVTLPLRNPIRCVRPTTASTRSTTILLSSCSHCPARARHPRCGIRRPEDAGPHRAAERPSKIHCVPPGYCREFLRSRRGSYRRQDRPRILRRGRRQETGGWRHVGHPKRFIPISNLAAAGTILKCISPQRGPRAGADAGTLCACPENPGL